MCRRPLLAILLLSAPAISQDAKPVAKMGSDRMYVIKPGEAAKGQYFPNDAPARIVGPVDKKKPPVFEDWTVMFGGRGAVVSVSAMPIASVEGLVIARDDVGVVLFVAVVGASDSRKVDYERWTKLELKDDIGNSYKQVAMRNDIPAEQWLGKPIRIDGREDPVIDLILFERPVKKAKEFTLDMPGENLGFKKPIRVAFSRELHDAAQSASMELFKAKMKK